MTRERFDTISGFSAVFALFVSSVSEIAEKPAVPNVQVETLIQSTSSWDGPPYEAYRLGQPQITVLKITIASAFSLKVAYAADVKCRVCPFRRIDH
jgi:hypothetical protein